VDRLGDLATLSRVELAPAQEVDDVGGYGVRRLLEDACAAERPRNVVLRSPIRFDYDEHNASTGHPAVHAHVLWAHCRFPVHRPLSVGHFLDFIFRNFYPDVWAEHEFLREWKKPLFDKTISLDEEQILHLGCRE
jgi:hypothetical protein